MKQTGKNNAKQGKQDKTEQNKIQKKSRLNKGKFIFKNIKIHKIIKID